LTGFQDLQDFSGFCMILHPVHPANPEILSNTLKAKTDLTETSA
jgi:hypothetical protein